MPHIIFKYTDENGVKRETIGYIAKMKRELFDKEIKEMINDGKYFGDTDITAYVIKRRYFDFNGEIVSEDE